MTEENDSGKEAGKGKSSMGAILVLGLIGVMLAVGIGVFATQFMPDYLRRGWQADLAKSGGVEAPARILSVTETGRWYAKKPVLQFTVQVSPAASSTFTSSFAQEISLMQVAQLRAGAAVQIRYNPAKPEQAVIVNQSAP